MILEEFRTALRCGQRVYGTTITSNSPLWPAITKNVGLDFVFIDTEHIALDRESVSWMCRAYAGLGIFPIVRIPSHCPYEATKMLDGGALGIVAPYVETVSSVKALVGAVRLRPLKGKRLAAALADTDDLELPMRQYLQKRNSDNVCIANIESVPAVENLDEILGVDGLDAVLIGPHDLSCSLGIPEQYHDPRFIDVVGEIIKKARSRAIGAGIHMIYGDIEQEVAWARQGANFILHSADALVVEHGLRREMERIRSGAGDSRIDDVVARQNKRISVI